MGTLLAGVLGIAIILLVIGLGWHVVWNGIRDGATTVKDAIVKVINYYFSDKSGNNMDSHSYPANSHSRGINKV